MWYRPMFVIKVRFLPITVCCCLCFSVRLLSVLRGHPCFSSPPQRPMTCDFYTSSYQLHFVLILILEKEPVFPFSMLSAKQGNYWYHCYNAFGITRSLTGDWNPGPPVLDASTLPLGYRGGGVVCLIYVLMYFVLVHY